MLAFPVGSDNTYYVYSNSKTSGFKVLLPLPVHLVRWALEALARFPFRSTRPYATRAAEVRHPPKRPNHWSLDKLANLKDPKAS